MQWFPWQAVTILKVVMGLLLTLPVVLYIVVLVHFPSNAASKLPVQKDWGQKGETIQISNISASIYGLTRTDISNTSKPVNSDISYEDPERRKCRWISLEVIFL